MLFRSALLVSLLAICAAWPGAAEKRATNPTVTIASGVLVGTATRVSNQPSNTVLATAFLGIPFASNPPLRFASPTPPTKWSAPLVVQTSKPICLQQQGPGVVGQRVQQDFENPVRGPFLPQSESCLYLNVYAPPSASPSNLKSVLFWIYGGNLASGGAAVAAYNGSSFAVNQDVVVVVPAYRTNIFGFSNSDEIAVGKQNAGFLDQRLALQWVQDNIAQFGGDKNNVTIFGESAGGWSVKQLLANPPKPTQGFRAAILESQGFGSSGNGATNYRNVSQHFGCDTAPSPLACLRALKATDIQYYIGNNSLSFPPVTGDGTSSGDFTNQNVDNGTFANVPVLIGSNNNEARVFLSEAGFNNSTDIVQGVFAITGINISSVVNWTNVLFPNIIAQGNYAILDRIITDLVFTCTSSLISNKIKNRQPTWRYRFDASFPSTNIYPDVGAYHSSEIFEVFGTYPLRTQFGSVVPDQVALAQYMQTAWANFAKNPAQGPGWNQFLDSNFNNLGVLGGVNNTAGLSQQNAVLTADYPCAVYDAVLLLANSAY